jgi:hypothetical protein
MSLYPILNLEINKSFSFAAKGYDQHGDEIDIPNIEWSTSNGSISKTGLLKVEDIEGVYTIKARYGEIISTSIVNVTNTQTSSVINVPIAPPLSPGKRKISWKGNVPPKKWNVFYLQVLSKFANDPDLKINVSFESETDSDTLEEEIKNAMKGMGISE